MPGRGAPEAGERRLLCVLHLHYYCGQSSHLWQRSVSLLYSQTFWIEHCLRFSNHCVVVLGTPCSIRRVCSPLSRNSSPGSSPKNTGRKQGRLRLPQLGSRHRLCNSKENLDACSNSKESETESEQGTVTDGENQMPSDANGQDTWSLDASSSDCDAIMVNGLGQDSSQSNGHSEVSTDLDTPHQRNDICLEPLYNLYAISVSDSSLHVSMCNDSFCKKPFWHLNCCFSFKCHSGIMGGGHYVTYAKNPNEKWYCYNDSSCKVRSQLCLFFDISWFSIIWHSYCTEYIFLQGWKILGQRSIDVKSTSTCDAKINKLGATAWSVSNYHLNLVSSHWLAGAFKSSTLFELN